MEIIPAAGGTAVVIPAFYICIGIGLFTCVQSALIGFLGHRKLLYLSFAAACFSGLAFQFFAISYYQSNSVEEAATSLRGQIYTNLVFMPFYFCFVASYTDQKKLNPWLALLCIVNGFLLIKNAAAPFSLRFSSLRLEAPLTFPWGEQLSFFRGTFSQENYIFRLSNNIVMAWTIFRAFKIFKSGKRRAAALLAACILSFSASIVWSTLIDAGILRSVYLVSISFLTFITLIGLSLALDVRENNRQLQETTKLLQLETQNREEIEYAVKKVASSASSQTGQHYFRNLVAVLADLFSADNAFVATFNDENNTISTLAFIVNGIISENVSYSIKNTPCALALKNGFFSCDERISTQFPNNKFLSDLKIKSYLGVSLKDSSGKNIGLIALLSHRPIIKAGMVEEIIDIVSARTVAEIERIRSERKIRIMAYQDYLTGLPNRVSLQQHLTAKIEKGVLCNLHGAMLLIDLDHFKTINDALSHDIGDEVLRKVGQRIAESTKDKGFPARLGGDEFVVVIEPQPIDLKEIRLIALQLANRVASELSKPIEIGEHVLNIGASIGIATYPDQGEGSLGLLRHADMALYQAKNMGRSTIQFYEAPMQTAAHNRLTLEKGLRKAIADSQLILTFQPQTNRYGILTGAEVLLRWEHPDLGDVSPTTFIPLAEETGLIHAMGSWVFEQACLRLINWEQSGLYFPGKLSINVSPWQFARPDFVTQVRNALARHNTNPKQITLEITESALMYDLTETIEKLNTLRALGLSISLDDFGTGYSSLSYLKQLPLDELKIDQSFVSELTVSENHPLVESMIAIGQHMHLDVIAEGVESAIQRDRLMIMGCERFQGYLYSRPLADREFQRWLKKNMERKAFLSATT